MDWTRIDSLILSSGSKVLAKFDFLRRVASDHIVDVSSPVSGENW
jgi:hypothetical protein